MTEDHSCSYYCDRPECIKAQRDELRDRLAQPEQEPVAWADVLGAIARGWTHDDNKHKTMDVQLAVAIAKEIQDMVIAPPQRKPLTKEEMFEAIRPLYYSEKDARGAVDISEDEYRAIEAAHGIKENT
jgi:hypothetical protein